MIVARRSYKCVCAAGTGWMGGLFDPPSAWIMRKLIGMGWPSGVACPAVAMTSSGFVYGLSYRYHMSGENLVKFLLRDA